MLISPNTSLLIEDLYQEFLQLNFYEQCVLKLLAVVYKPIGIGKLNTLIKRSTQTYIFSDAEKFNALSVEQKDQLIEREFISQTKDGITINRLLANRLVSDCMAENQYLNILQTAESVTPAMYYASATRIDARIVRDLFFLADYQKVEEILQLNKNPQIIDIKQTKPLIELVFAPFNLKLFLDLPDCLQYQSFAAWFADCKNKKTSNEYAFELLQQACEHSPDNESLTHLLAEQFLYKLRFSDFKKTCSADDKSCYGLQLNAAYQFLQGEFLAAHALFEQAMKAKNKYARRKKQYLGDTLGLFNKLCLLVLGAKESVHYYDVIGEQLEFEIGDHRALTFSHTAHALDQTVKCLSSGAKYTIIHDKYQNLIRLDPFNAHIILLLSVLSERWCNGDNNQPAPELLAESEAFFEQLSLPLFATVAAQITGNISANDSAILNFTNLISHKAEWDIALEKLIALNPQTETKHDVNPKVEKPIRLIWEMHLHRNKVQFKAREQKQNTKGWSKGRMVALKRLYEEPEQFNYLTEADLAMCQAIEAYQGWGYYSSTEYELEGVKTLLVAKNLDNLYLATDLQIPIELKQTEPELWVSQQGSQLLLSMANLPDNFDSNQNKTLYSIKETSPECYAFMLFNEAHLKVANIIGEGGLLIPNHAKNKVLESVMAIAPVLNIQSDIEELDTGLETIVNDECLVINIQPVNDGLEFMCMVMPFGEDGPAYKPTVGNAKLTTEIKGKRIATQRDFVKEHALLDALDTHCPAFLAMADNVLSIDELQGSLETVEQLEHVVNQDPMPFNVRLRWPKGKKISLTKALESQHLQLAVGKKNEWFDLKGELTVDNGEVLELRILLELVATTQGRFIPLDSGKILVLSQNLKQKLDMLNQATDGGKFHQLASVQVAEATTGMRMKTLHAWDAQTTKMHEANVIMPKLPNTLQADLRDYQIVGFDWMSRLAHWGAGACLADDMGLGKTLQALAVLLDRASNGPSLVIAPTSVCFNWQQEAAKFAPTLNIKFFADANTSDEREQLLNEVKAFDCVIISYGLLQRASDMLARVQWHTIVADEAQALKNPLAKRTQAACALKGDFKIITTGTPIENNLTELWSLFRFITPGLLGSLKRFGERYALPIENVKEDKLAARKASLGLKTLIQPFILRRMKNQVLTELPPRTEINIAVELSAPEQAFYEAIRLNAIDNISQATQTSNMGEQRIRMLAELVKLRQACCNPALIMADTDLPSAKMAALDNLLDELQQNNHKALIFSQFVGHLQLIKKHLALREISYQYLDGSTPQKARAQRVNAFQNGESDVFLISLKAGGSGLNLTAADYVIHMDPWWNPAVEEQASDRAHRMGQQRPVTIYRLIAKNTIEERIVALHQHKRDLADKLLAGNEEVTKLSVEDMLNMLKETF
ncbi:DEAD/DEAH box helicase [Algibacillus agarilyticus]|uniref:DEAD/DEAH box helicase n=1 Tax=Algibacillus agarilyticus TaxID=2234133 RepID=UPI000DD06646|nr:DEAD/DEAH box helicase [Algibacillus agarilyticus]